MSLKAGKFKPYLHYSTYDREEHTEAGESEIETNSPNMFDDNQRIMALGTTYEAFGPHLKPYFVFISKSGDFLDKNN